MSFDAEDIENFGILVIISVSSKEIIECLKGIDIIYADEK